MPLNKCRTTPSFPAASSAWSTTSSDWLGVGVEEVLEGIHACDMPLGLGQGLLAGVLPTGVGRIDLGQADLRARLDDESLAVVHLGAS